MKIVSDYEGYEDIPKYKRKKIQNLFSFTMNMVDQRKVVPLGLNQNLKIDLGENEKDDDIHDYRFTANIQ